MKTRTTPHPEVKIFGRNRPGPKTAVETFAYRLGIPLRDNKSGKLTISHRRSREKDILYAAFMPENAKHLEDPQTFCNALELAERQENSQLTFETMLPLPRMMDRKQHIEALYSLGYRFLEMGYCGFIALHQGPKGDNPHLHAVFALRKLDEFGNFCKTKERDFYPPAVRIEKLLKIRGVCQDAINEVFERHNSEWRVDFRSYEDRGILRAAKKHVSPYFESDYGRKIAQHNAEADEINRQYMIELYQNMYTRDAYIAKCESEAQKPLTSKTKSENAIFQRHPFSRRPFNMRHSSHNKSSTPIKNVYNKLGRQ